MTSELHRRVLDAVDEARVTGLLQRMIQSKSYSNTSGEGELATWLGEDLRAQGLDVEHQEIAPGRLNTLAWLRGVGGGDSLMLNGHIDTNPAGEGWTKDPLGGAVEDGCIFGIGVSNMKAADAAMIEAVTAVQAAGIRTKGDVCVALVVGELQGGVGTLHLLQQGIRTDYFIVGEPTDLSVLTLHAGSFEFKVHVIGRTRHLSKMEEGISAIDKAFDVIQALKRMKFSGAERADYAGLNRLNVGVIRGGMTREYMEWRVPQVPDFCTVKVAGRLAPSQSPETALADVRATLAGLNDPDLQFEVEQTPYYVKGYMPAFEIAPDHPFLVNLRANHEEATGQEPRVGDVAPYKFYGTDGAHLASTGGMTGVVYGPGGKYNTMADERVEIADLVAAARVYALAIVDTCGVA
jgi:acetylornithine deacetylase